eukprot:scaffold530_cov107-Cylindrotheca_fusiformis.AAC.16
MSEQSCGFNEWPQSRTRKSTIEYRVFPTSSEYHNMSEQSCGFNEWPQGRTRKSTIEYRVFPTPTESHTLVLNNEKQEARESARAQYDSSLVASMNGLRAQQVRVLPTFTEYGSLVLYNEKQEPI